MTAIHLAASVLALGLIPAATSVHAQYPERPIRLIVPFATGSATDTSARLYAVELSRLLAQQVLPDNRPGAGGAIGMQLLTKASPDGYTIAYAGAGPLSINPSITPNVPYNVERDVQPVSQAVSSPLMLAVSPTLPIKSVKDLVALAKSRPGQLSNGSAGNGTIGHLAGEYFKLLTATSILHIPYKGGAQAATDVMTGNVQMMFDPASGVSPHVKSGRLRGLAVTSLKRAAAFPNLPTIAESGIAGYDVTTWGGIIAPAGTPKAIVARLSEAMQQAAKAPNLVERYAALGADPMSSTPEAFADLIRRETLKWADVVKRAKIQI